MDALTPELVACICNSVDSLPDLVALRGTGRRYRDIVDRFGKKTSYDFCRAHIPAFDDALLAVRIARIPIEDCCHYIPSRNEYSFITSQKFFQAVMEGRPVPQGCPSVPSVAWIKELAAVMDIYLLSLAWQSTSEVGQACINSIGYGGSLIAGTEITGVLSTLAHEYVEAFVRSFFRVQTLTSCFGPRIFAEPISDALGEFGELLSEIDVDTDIAPEVVLDYMRKFPMYRRTVDYTEIHRSDQNPLRGFFEWLYRQVHPSNVDFSGRMSRWTKDTERYLSEDQRRQVGLLQLVKVSELMSERMPDHYTNGINPGEAHVKALHNPTYGPMELLPVIGFRPKLTVSCWSNPLTIIHNWARQKDIASIVVEKQCNEWGPKIAYDVGGCGPLGDLEEETVPFFRVLEVELASKFGLTYFEERIDSLPDDGGLLYPLGQTTPV
jgi:hypothetical protein